MTRIWRMFFQDDSRALAGTGGRLEACGPGGALQCGEMKRRILVLWLIVLGLAGAASARSDAELWRRVEVIRTAHGVPHIRAQDLRSAGYALGWIMLEDYGRVAAADLLESSGRWAAVDGYERVEADFVMRTLREKTLAKYPQLSKDVRDVYEGF